jgi:hypothetical protein
MAPIPFIGFTDKSVPWALSWRCGGDSPGFNIRITKKVFVMNLAGFIGNDGNDSREQRTSA